MTKRLATSFCRLWMDCNLDLVKPSGKLRSGRPVSESRGSNLPRESLRMHIHSKNIVHRDLHLGKDDGKNRGFVFFLAGG